LHLLCSRFHAARSSRQLALGAYAVLEVHSFRVDSSTCDYPLTEDRYHFWPVGVYVP